MKFLIETFLVQTQGAVEKSTVEIQTEPSDPSEPAPTEIPTGSDNVAEISAAGSDDIFYKTALSDFSPDFSLSSKNSTPVPPPFESYSVSPGNSLLNRSSWSSGFVSNWAPEEANFNELLQNALAGSQRLNNGLILGTSPIQAVESGSGGDIFNDTANQRELEVGKV